MILQRLNKIEKILKRTTKKIKLVNFGYQPTAEEKADSDLMLVELPEELVNKLNVKLET
jgi:hypothetical protein